MIDSVLTGWTPHSDMPATPTLKLEGQAEYLKDESAVDKEFQDRVLDGCGRGKYSTSVKLISEGSSEVKEESLLEANEPEDIAAMAIFLASNGARNITGQSFNVDGGLITS